jgi:hypothetical protein
VPEVRDGNAKIIRLVSAMTGRILFAIFPKYGRLRSVNLFSLLGWPFVNLALYLPMVALKVY